MSLLIFDCFLWVHTPQLAVTSISEETPKNQLQIASRKVISYSSACCDWVFDSSPLIHLGKVRILEKLEKIDCRRLIPISVYREVVEEGMAGGREDAFYLKRLVDEGIFEVVKAGKIIGNLPATALSPADCEVLSLAKEKNGLAVMDEDAGRKIAEWLEIRTIGSVGILFNLFRRGIVSKREFKKIIDLMIGNGWYCSTSLYSYVLDRLAEREEG